MKAYRKFDKVKALVFTSLAHFTNDGNFLLFSLLVVYFYNFNGVSLVFLGALATIYNVIYGILSLPLGKMADRRDSDSLLLLIGLGLEGSAAALFGLAFLLRWASEAFIVLGIIALGAGQAFYHPIGASILSFSFDKKKLGAALGINGSMGSIGRALAPSLITFLVLYLGTSIGLETFSVYTWVLALVVYFGLRDFHRTYKKTERKKLNAAYKMPKALLKKLCLVSAPVFFRSAFLIGTVTFAAEYLYHVTASAELTGIILSISFILPIIGQPIFGYLTSIIGGKQIVSVTTVVSLFAFAAFLMTDNTIVMTVAYSAVTFLLFNGFSVFLDYSYQLVPPRYYSTSYSFVWGIGNTLGGAAGLALITYLLTFNGITIAMYYMIVPLAVSIILLPLLPKDTKL